MVGAVKTPIIEININATNVTEEALHSAKPILERCRESAASVKDIFNKTIPTKDASRAERMRKAMLIKSNSNKVKEHMEDICKNMELLAQNQVFQDAEALNDIKVAIEHLSNITDEELPQFIHSGSGAMNANIGPGTQENYNNPGSCSIYKAEKQYFGQGQENRDKLLLKSIEWIFNDPQYLVWKDGPNVGLLWIKGGAGKGKTMMSIGLIERLLAESKYTSVVTYFFCQDADYRLNTVEAIIKGLILRLVNQQEELKRSLRDRWDTVNERFDENLNSWRWLWNIFMQMLDSCKCSAVYVIVDALDECRDDDGMTHLLKLIVRNGLNRPSHIKWLLTSRPLDSAEQELLAGLDQVQVSLELNSRHVSEAVKTYIAYKVTELGRRHRYGLKLQKEIEIELNNKAEDTFLWVSLVCKRLETVCRDKALVTIQDLQPGLPLLYHWMLDQLREGDSALAEGCMRLLQVMVLAYRPLNVAEVGSVTGLSDEEEAIKALVDRCASFIKMRGIVIEFVHQSARDYLAGKHGRLVLDKREQYGHAEIVRSCMTHLSSRLKVNFVDLPRVDSTQETIKALNDRQRNKLMASVDYAATFWVQHLDAAKRKMTIQDVLAVQAEVGAFLPTKFLEWLECLSLLNKLPFAIEALVVLRDFADPHTNLSLSTLVQDGARFLSRHYPILAAWPLQMYSSAIIFSPQSSVVRVQNLDKVPSWLKNTLKAEETWASLIQTLAHHADSVRAVAFSPDSKRIASGSDDKTVKLCDTATGEVQRRLVGHLGEIMAVAFLPDGKQVVSGSQDRTIRLWNATTEEVQTTLTGRSGWVLALAFSPHGKQVASGSDDNTGWLWDTTTGKLQATLIGHSGMVMAVAFSPDGKRIVSGSADNTVKLWDATTGELQITLTDHWGGVMAVAFSPDGKRILSGSGDSTVRLLDAITGAVQTTLAGHLGEIMAVAFSHDGKRIASGSADKTVRLWDATTGEVQITLTGHSDWVNTVAFSPDGKRIASGSDDKTVKLWDATIGEVQRMPVSHSGEVTAVAFSLDGKRIVSGSEDKAVKLWDVATGEVQMTLTGHLSEIRAVAFSPDGKRIASGSDDETVKLWDTTIGKIQMTLVSNSSRVTAVAFSPDGKRIVSGSVDKTIRLWDATTGKLQTTLTGHLDWVIAVAFSLDGKRIASGSEDLTVKLWDVAKSGKALILSIETSETVHNIKFSAGDRYLETNLGDIDINTTTTNGNSTDIDSFKHLRVSNQWMCYGPAPVLRIPADFEARCYDESGDQMTIGFANGRVLSFDIDRRRLHAELAVGIQRVLGVPQ